MPNDPRLDPAAAWLHRNFSDDRIATYEDLSDPGQLVWREYAARLLATIEQATEHHSTNETPAPKPNPSPQPPHPFDPKTDDPQGWQALRIEQAALALKTTTPRRDLIGSAPVSTTSCIYADLRSLALVVRVLWRLADSSSPVSSEVREAMRRVMELSEDPILGEAEGPGVSRQVATPADTESRPLDNPQA